MQYVVARARGDLQLAEQLDLAGRTGEMARAFGIDFFSVLARGSQYRVESMMLRLAHSQNYVVLSPTKEQVMRCMTILPYMISDATYTTLSIALQYRLEIMFRIFQPPTPIIS